MARPSFPPLVPGAPPSLRPASPYRVTPLLSQHPSRAPLPSPPVPQSSASGPEPPHRLPVFTSCLFVPLSTPTRSAYGQPAPHRPVRFSPAGGFTRPPQSLCIPRFPAIRSPSVLCACPETLCSRPRPPPRPVQRLPAFSQFFSDATTSLPLPLPCLRNRSSRPLRADESHSIPDRTASLLPDPSVPEYGPVLLFPAKRLSVALLSG